jgi:nicotinamidase/pyrazinamidase
MLGICFVDVQNDFMLSDGALPVPGAEKLIRRLNYLLTWAKEQEHPFWFTQDNHRLSDSELLPIGPFPPHCIVKTFGQSNIMELPTDGGTVFLKRCYDVWDRQLGMPNELEICLSSLRITTMLLAGVATDYCVKAAAIGFAQRGVKVTVLSDMTAGVAKESTDMAIKEMLEQGIKYLPFEKALL